MTDFYSLINRVLGNEGRYSDDPRDPGGETIWGITKNVATANGYFAPMQLLSRDKAIEIYRSEYWEKPKYNTLRWELGYQLLDCGVNQGVLTATRMLQQVVGVKDDGVIGDMTRGAIAAGYLPSVILSFLSVRSKHYVQTKNFDIYGRGWENRMADCMQYAADDLRAYKTSPVVMKQGA